MNDPLPDEKTQLRAWLAARPSAPLHPDDLAAWAEGQLKKERAEAVELALAQDPALRRAVRGWLSTPPSTPANALHHWWRALQSALVPWQHALVPSTCALMVAMVVVLGLELGEGIALDAHTAQHQRIASLLGPLEAGEHHVQ